MTSPDPVRAQIVDAWRDAVYPGDDRICAPTYDDEGVGAYFKDRTWDGHDVASLRYHAVGLSFFTAEAFAYYLAAYMLAVIDDPVEADFRDSIVFHLSPRQLAKHWSDRYVARVACLSPAQKAAVIAFLRRYPQNAEVDQTIEYLETGRIAPDVSPFDRLLALAGAADRDRLTLERLSLSYSKVTDAELAGLRELPALRELDLCDCAITEAGLAQLLPAAALRSLDLSNCKSLTAAAFTHVAACSQLEELKLANTNLDDACIEALAPLQLRRLDATHAREITAAGWNALDVRRLERLDMYGVDPGDALLARIGEAGRLRKLIAKTISDAGLVALARAPLVELEIGTAEGVTEVGLAALAQISTLRVLQLNTIELRRCPAGWPALDQLVLLNMELRASFAEGIGAMPQLRELRLWATAIEPGAIAAVSRAPHLDRLTIWCKHGMLLLEELAGATSLQTLEVHDATLTTAAISALAQLPSLARLSLDRVTPLDESALRALATTHTQELSLSDVDLDEAHLDLLGRAPSLRRLRVSGRRVTAATLSSFRRAHPSIEIIEL